MKRTEIQPGAKSLARGSTFSAERKPLERVSSLKSTTDGKGKGRRPVNPAGVEQRKVWAVEVRSKPCLMCQASPPEMSHAQRHVYGPDLRRLDAHHLIPKGTLIREGHAAHIHDSRNGASICRFHHSRHHAYVERIPRSLLPVAVFEFAAELGLEAILDREYPTTVRRVTNEREAA